MDEALARRIQSKLKAACYGNKTGFAALFARYDTDRGGNLDRQEFKSLVRTKLKISPVRRDTFAFNAVPLAPTLAPTLARTQAPSFSPSFHPRPHNHLVPGGASRQAYLHAHPGAR